MQIYCSEDVDFKAFKGDVYVIISVFGESHKICLQLALVLRQDRENGADENTILDSSIACALETNFLLTQT